MLRLAFIITLFICIPAQAGKFAQFQVGNPSQCGLAPCTGGAFRPLIGGGGFFVDFQTASDGSQITNSDSAGPWYRSSYTQKWQSAINSSNLPILGNATTRCANGCYDGPGGGIGCAIAIANSNTNVLWVWAVFSLTGATPAPPGGSVQHIYKNTNKISGTWTEEDSGFPLGEFCWPNGNTTTKWNNPRMAIDPFDSNGNIVYVNTPIGGIYYTINGTSWQIVSSVPPSLPVGATTTSTTSNAIGTGSKTFTIGSCNFEFNTNVELQIWQTSVPANIMTGTVTSCSGTSLTLTVNNSWGSGSGITDWSITSALDQQNTGPAGGEVAFDPSDNTGNTVYLTSQNRGIWKCTSATTAPSCTQNVASGVPITFKGLVIGTNGTVWVVDNSVPGGGLLYRLKSGAWVQPAMPTSHAVEGIVIDPSTSSPCGSTCVYTVDNTGCLYFSTNGDAAGTPTFTNSTGSGNCVATTDYSMSSTTIPWAGYAFNSAGYHNLAVGFVGTDPTQSHIVYAETGRWILKATAPQSSGPAVAWVADETTGAENLDMTNGQVLPAGYGIAMAAQDIPLMLTTGSPPTRFLPTTTFANPGQIAGKSQTCGDYNASSAQISMSEEGENGASGINNNTWTGFIQPTVSWVYGGCVPVDANHWILMPNSLGPQYTTNQGADNFGNTCTFGNTITGNHPVTAGGGGWYDGQPTNLDIIAMNAAGTILLYNTGNVSSNPAQAKGIWENTTGVSPCSFTQVNNTLSINFSGNGTSSLRAVPGKNDFFASALGSWAVGSTPNANQIFQNHDGSGTTWTAISSVESPLAWGFGAPLAGSDGYPTFYCACWVDTGGGFVYGIWQAKNIDTWNGSTTTWTNIDTADGGFPGGNTDDISWLLGDMQTAGTVYVGFNNSGGMYRTAN